MTRATPQQHAAGLVEAFLDQRLKDADEPPGLREAIIGRVQDRLDEIGKRGGQQISQLRSGWSRRFPDAYLVDEEVLEEELQTAAAGIRTARAVEGLLTDDPRGFELALTQRLASTARWAMRAEASRVPRPATRPSTLEWSLPPIPWAEGEAEWPLAAAVAMDSGYRRADSAAAGRVTNAPYTGWVQLGLVERQRTFAGRNPDAPARELLICAGIEALDQPPPTDSAPLSKGPPNAWSASLNRLLPRLDAEVATTRLGTAQGGLAALIDYETQFGAPHRLRGAGLPPFALVPKPEVIALLGLRPERLPLRHVLVDDQERAALVGRLWRGYLIHAGDYTPLVPAIDGGDLIIRPDLYDRLETAAGKERINVRCTVSHSESAGSSDDEDFEM